MSSPLTRLREMREKSRRNNGTHESRVAQARAQKRYSAALRNLAPALLEYVDAGIALRRGRMEAFSLIADPLERDFVLALDALQARAREVVDVD
jgi:hypothetical protein